MSKHRTDDTTPVNRSNWHQLSPERIVMASERHKEMRERLAREMRLAIVQGKVRVR